MSVEATIFREYIGSQDGSKHQNFPLVIINENVKEFHFIVAFSKESYDDGKGLGNFQASWDTHGFSKENILNLKKRTNAKVIVSIGGPTVFNPKEKNEWLENAKNSLTKLINDYLFDGIDINYETISSDTSYDDFNFCIGGLIKHLKEDSVIKIASIAPSDAVNPYYSSLYKLYKDDINWVDYKFYAHPLPSKEDYIKFYKKLSHEDYPEHLLAGFSTNAKHASILSQGTFLDACQELKNANLLPGIFVSDADYSSPSYKVEGLAQKIIASSNRNA